MGENTESIPFSSAKTVISCQNLTAQSTPILIFSHSTMASSTSDAKKREGKAIVPVEESYDTLYADQKEEPWFKPWKVCFYLFIFQVLL